MCKNWKQHLPIRKRNTSYIIAEEVQCLEKISTQRTIRSSSVLYNSTEVLLPVNQNHIGIGFLYCGARNQNQEGQNNLLILV